MRHKDPELMKKIRTYIGEFYIEHDRTPSTTEIANDQWIRMRRDVAECVSYLVPAAVLRRAAL